MDDAGIANALAYDFSAGTEVFRESLLARCLAVLVAGGDNRAGSALPNPAAPVEIDENTLDMLAAAGDVFTTRSNEREE